MSHGGVCGSLRWGGGDQAPNTESEQYNTHYISIYTDNKNENRSEKTQNCEKEIKLL